MIYLFDDKKNRQADFGWNELRFLQNKESIVPIYVYTQVAEKPIREEMFSEGNVILFHESFFDNVLNNHKKAATEIRNSLSKYSIENKNFRVAYFSGSKHSRSIDKNIAHLPVSILYQNLEIFLQKEKQNVADLRHLLFGEYFEIEETLQLKLESANNQIEDSVENEKPDSENFIAQTFDNDIERIFDNAKYETFFLDERHHNQITDTYLSEKIFEWLNEKEYDNIFIPLCFGPVLSDFNGLRFATHIRCTKSPNQLKPIFLYSFVDYTYLVNNEYFDILKTKNVFLIDYRKAAFSKAIKKSHPDLTTKELPNEIVKIKLTPPKNYEDNHGIANEWAIYRWASAINAIDEDIEKVIQKVDNQLYFKYLQTVYPISEIPEINEAQLRIKYSGFSPKVLYIDDEADKGWYEIFCNILYDINKIDFDYLDAEFKGKTRNDIINISIEKIKNDDIDVVILDFRLHPDDFILIDIQQVTGLKLLKAIKEINPGIQVIIFSATNKVWNYQALQEAGADGFIVKESPEHSSNSHFTTQSIIEMVKSLEKLLTKTFLKKLFQELLILKSELIPRKNYKKSAKPLPKDFVDEVLNWLELSYNQLNINLSQTNRTSAFLFMFSVLENLANRVICIDNPIQISVNPNRYNFEFRANSQPIKIFIEDQKSGHYKKTIDPVASKYRGIPWTFKILNTLDYISQKRFSEKDLSNLINKRNNIIHANITTGDKTEIKIDDLKFLNNILFEGLRNVV